MDISIQIIQQKLKEPLAREDIEFRVCRTSVKARKLNVIAYLTARGIMSRLDEIFGINHWKDEYEVLTDGVKCKLSVYLDGEWVTKEDVASFTNIEALKGAFSDSLKRAGVKFGIGRYLYDVPDYWVEVKETRPANGKLPIHYHSSDGMVGYWTEPQLPSWALPVTGAGNRKKDQPDPTLPKNELLEGLLQENLVTKSKYDQYVRILSGPNISRQQKDLASEQLSLIKQWGQYINNNGQMAPEVQKNLYRQIINSTAGTIHKVKTEILNQQTRREVA